MAFEELINVLPGIAKLLAAVSAGVAVLMLVAKLEGNHRGGKEKGFVLRLQPGIPAGVDKIVERLRRSMQRHAGGSSPNERQDDQ